jgi:hypothetical protein
MNVPFMNVEELSSNIQKIDQWAEHPNGQLEKKKRTRQKGD